MNDVNTFRYAVLGTLLVGGFFAFGSFVLICHICWIRKVSRNFNLRSTRHQVLTRSDRSQVPYRRTSPSMNLAYEPPHDTDLQDDTPPRSRAHILLSHKDLPPRNPTLNSHWASEDLSPRNPSFCNVTPLRHHAIHEALPNPHQVYSNIQYRNKQYTKVQHVKSLQIEPTINQHHAECSTKRRSATERVQLREDPQLRLLNQKGLSTESAQPREDPQLRVECTTKRRSSTETTQPKKDSQQSSQPREDPQLRALNPKKISNESSQPREDPQLRVDCSTKRRSSTESGVLNQEKILN
ncbi:unnamed protein product [Ranitomeya imitator]|uniref:Uncharacterized protein n=1 Tax=Ranitomeya imitator TaxID=111125 RepID=A0ABN9L927_9NEOB|nr:unnamed protein product [Ranitomeya imitator]